MATSENKDTIKQQAVVIIHGIGEQKPMATLRSFVKGIKFWIQNDRYNEEARPYTWSRPDGISEMYETRRITMEKYCGNKTTDFYEFYWAHHMRNTSWKHLLPWLWKLIKTDHDKVPPRLQHLQIRVRDIVYVAIIILPVLAVYFKFHFVAGIGALAVFFWLVRAALRLAEVPLSNLILSYAGDAARYFNPIPDNIEERSTIRREGIAFLKKLHDCSDYDRIVVVGHSLGSVVAYDLIRLLWNDMYNKFENPVNPDEVVFVQMNAMIERVTDMEAEGASDVAFSESEMENFRALQHECWKQYRQNGNKWLITDFITCAGAVAHADFFLLDEPGFDERKEQKEMPVCPPFLQKGDRNNLIAYYDDKTILPSGTDMQDKVHPLHHAAPFAVTRWTNIYFSGDYVGSKARRKFRCGVQDIEVDKEGSSWIPVGHTNYWDADSDNKALGHIARAIGFRRASNTNANASELSANNSEPSEKKDRPDQN